MTRLEKDLMESLGYLLANIANLRRGEPEDEHLEETMEIAWGVLRRGEAKQALYRKQKEERAKLLELQRRASKSHD